jgi:hypothetical protein
MFVRRFFPGRYTFRDGKNIALGAVSVKSDKRRTGRSVQYRTKAAKNTEAVGTTDKHGLNTKLRSFFVKPSPTRDKPEPWNRQAAKSAKGRQEFFIFGL